MNTRIIDNLKSQHIDEQYKNIIIITIHIVIFYVFVVFVVVVVFTRLARPTFLPTSFTTQSAVFDCLW